jgi:hypothetical protein
MTQQAPDTLTVTIPDDDTLRMVTFKLSARHREYLRVEAFRRHTTKSEILRDAIDRMMAEQEGRAA